MGHQPPRQPKSLAAAIPLITDAKVHDWRGGSGPIGDIAHAQSMTGMVQADTGLFLTTSVQPPPGAVGLAPRRFNAFCAY